ncbi:S24 family peptidase [Marinobacter sp. 3-2]|uniref:S24 family peptidase n=1 Tax=Marinobacter sp. 3-2 TaxID=2485141 RepID=UPI0021A5465E|nr:S24 family peptidase [Marinobacter sp. 3-2]
MGCSHSRFDLVALALQGVLPQACEVRDGRFYVIRNRAYVLVKRIQTLWNDGVQLLSDNKEYPPQEISSSDLETLEVIGKVVWAGKDL